MHVQLSPKHSQRHHFVCLFLCCAFIFLGWFFLFSTNGRTRRQHNYPWETDAHLAITNRLWRRAGCRSWYTGAIYILTADLRGSSKLCTSDSNGENKAIELSCELDAVIQSRIIIYTKTKAYWKVTNVGFKEATAERERKALFPNYPSWNSTNQDGLFNKLNKVEQQLC